MDNADKPIERLCRRCDQLRHRDDFKPNRNTCTPCIAQQERKRRTPAVLAKLRVQAAERSRQAREILNYLKSNPCVDCGGRFPVACMHFDHRDYRTKRKIVAVWASAGLIPQMLGEIERCDLVCANCHAIRTDRRRHDGTQPYRGRPRKYPDYVDE